MSAREKGSAPAKKKGQQSSPRKTKSSTSNLISVLVLAVAAGAVYSGSRYFDLPWRSKTSQQKTSILPGVSRFGHLQPPPFPTSHPALTADIEKRYAIRQATKDSWDAYVKYGWGADECHPLTFGSSNLTSQGGVGYQIVDALDTLLVMGLNEEFKKGAKWVKEELIFDRDADFSTFETTIRLLGGLLSAYHLSSSSLDTDIQSYSQIFLDKAIDLGDRLLGAYNTASGLPYPLINLKTRIGSFERDNAGIVSLAESASIQLEMKYLSEITGDYVYWRAAEKVTKIIKEQAIFDGIAPIFMEMNSGRFIPSEIRLGSRGDSYYEYLLKQWLQSNREESVYKNMYDESMGGIKKHMVGKTKKSGILFTQELVPGRHPQTGENTWQISPKQDHLVCFLGGSLILGVTEGQNTISWDNLDERERDDFILGDKIIESCMETYNTPTGLGPEIAMFRMYTEPEAEYEDWYIKSSTTSVLIDGRNILRPETVESLFLAYRATGNEKYREAGWKVFKAFEKYCKAPKGGYVGVEDVMKVPPVQLDRMETFWLGETLKYLYLLFDDSTNIPLDKYVFNTEAHILPVFSPNHLTEFSTS